MGQNTFGCGEQRRGAAQGDSAVTAGAVAQRRGAAPQRGQGEGTWHRGGCGQVTPWRARVGALPCAVAIWGGLEDAG